MVKPLPSKIERMVRAVLLLATSLTLTLLAYFFGLYNSQDSRMVAITILVIIVIAVLVSRTCAKPVMRLWGRNP